ncbi:MAG: alpha-L-fucosidase [Kiritimatiellaeota bacterium]|nr:alpha-L-fucosidase [Kiritimatiellota bacterium]
MWHSKSFRRNLVDMHIADWDPAFLSEFSVDTYFDNLVRGRVQSAMIYLQSHAGLCYWPTRAGRMHAAFKGREDTLRRLVEKCRANGIDVVGYYSLIFNTWAEDLHPEWRMRDAEGLSRRDRKGDPAFARGARYGLCCPNNAGYRAFVAEQIREMSEYFKMDGMYYDMLYWSFVCHCDACKKRFADETGLAFPAKVDWRDPAWLALNEKRPEWMGEFAMSVTRLTRGLMPGVTVQHNCSSLVSGNWECGADERVNEACDFTGGDLYGGPRNHSFTCKYYLAITKNPPFEYQTCRCEKFLTHHTVTKSERTLEQEIMLTCAHHGASFIIDAIDPKGTMDRRVYDRVGEIFKRHERYEPHLAGRLVADAGVFYAGTSRYNPDGLAFTNKECALGVSRTLIENHVPFGVVSNGCVDKIFDCKFLFVPNLFGASDDVTGKIIDYVRGGGNLYFSGAGNARLLRELAGLEYTGNLTREKRTYIAPAATIQPLFDWFNADFPLPIDNPLPIVKFIAPNETAAATITLPYTHQDEPRFASIHSDPPGIRTNHPALVIKKFGKGNVIWSAAPIELDDRAHYKKILMNLMGLFLRKEDRTVAADTTKNVEVVSFKADDGFLIGAVDLKCDDELVPVRSFEVRVKTGAPVKSVVRLPGMEPKKGGKGMKRKAKKGHRKF